MRKFIAAAALLLVLPAFSQAKTLEQLLAEKGVITKAEASSAASAGPAKVYWKDGTRVEFPDNGFTIKVATMLQPRYEFTDTPEGVDNASSFELNNARLEVTGTVLHEEFEYAWEWDAESQHVKKAYLQWNACDWGYARMGQFKTAISRQYLTSNWKKMFADDSVASDYFNFGYQKGVRAEGRLADGEVVIGANLSNGNSDGEGEYADGVDTHMMISTDLRWNAMGTMDVFEEGDINMTQDAALSFGAAYAYSSSKNQIGGVQDELGTNRVSFDANFKYAGWGLNAEYYISRDNPDFAETVDTQGAYVQAGYFVMPKQLELALRWSMVDCDDGKGYGECAGLEEVQEASAGVNYYFWKHNLKAQLNYVHQSDRPEDGEDQKTNKWLLQLASYF